jgi:hypothetical protein
MNNKDDFRGAAVGQLTVLEFTNIGISLNNAAICAESTQQAALLQQGSTSDGATGGA